VRIEIVTDWPERLAPGAQVWLEGRADPLTVERIESGGRVPVVYLDAIHTREAAEPLAGRYLEMPPHELPTETYYWDDLIGLRVESSDGSAIGELVEIFRAGGNEVYRVVGPRGERLVPALRRAVLRIDLPAGLMVVAEDDAEEVR
jgi:16S rRNA processing protein RimM